MFNIGTCIDKDACESRERKLRHATERRRRNPNQEQSIKHVETHSSAKIPTLIEEMDRLSTHPIREAPYRKAVRHRKNGRTVHFCPRSVFAVGDWTCPKHPNGSFSYGISRQESRFTFGTSSRKEENRFRRKKLQNESSKKNTANPFTPNNIFNTPQFHPKMSTKESPYGFQEVDAMTETLHSNCLQLVRDLKQQGRNALEEAQYEKAGLLFSDGLGLIMGDTLECKKLMSSLLCGRAEAHFMLSNLDSALKDANDALTIHPKNIGAHQRAATILTSKGQFQEAERILHKALDMLSASAPHFDTVKQQIRETNELEKIVQEMTIQCETGEINPQLLNSLNWVFENVQYFDEVWKAAAFLYLQTCQYDDIFSTREKCRLTFGFQETDVESLWWDWIQMEATWWNPKVDFSNTFQAVSKLLEKMQRHNVNVFETTPQTDNLVFDDLRHWLDQMNMISTSREKAKNSMMVKDYGGASELYTECIKICESAGCAPHFLAIFYCNRGGALHGQGKYAEAMADVSVALSLNPDYLKAYKRLIRMNFETNHFSEARQVFDTFKERVLFMTHFERCEFDKLERSIALHQDRRPVDAFKMLGLDRWCDANDVKRVFKKLALKFHPDKAHSIKLRLSWMRNKNVLFHTLEKRIRDDLHHRMQGLFKQINDAQGVLTDPEKRRKLIEKLFATQQRCHSYFDRQNYGGCYRPRW